MTAILQKEVRIFKAKDGKKPLVEWLNKLKDPVTKARIRRRIDRLEEGTYGDYKSLSDGLFELRLAFGPGYRIYFVEESNVIIILVCGGDKSTQSKDIEKAKKFVQILRGTKNE